MHQAMNTAHSDRILVVDDQPANLQVLFDLLTRQGYQIRPAMTGELAIKSAQAEPPDLILLDIRLPDMDGYEVCRQLKVDSRTCEIPILFLSVLDETFDKVKGFQVGGVDYITKPFQPEEVLVRVRIHLRLRELTERLEHTVAERTTELARSNQELQVEIAERKRVEEELRKHRDHLEELVRERTAELVIAKEKALEAQRRALEAKEVAEKAQRRAEAAQRASEAAQRASEAANRAKSAFLAHMSHELRTPLNGILAYADILRRRTGEASPLAEGLDIIQQSGEHLLTLINDILDLARIEAGKIDLQPAPVDLPDFLRQILGIMRARADVKHLPLRYEEPSPLPAGILADETRLRQVLLNLLGNAVKFTDQGSVTLKIEYCQLNIEDGKTCVVPEQSSIFNFQFSIIDTGPGIAPEQLERIFEPFEQAGGLAKQREGAGLGLAISRQIVQRMGGQLHGQSTVGQGSTFWFDVALPIAPAAEPEQPMPARSIVGYEGGQRTILVVDDKVYNRLVIRDLLEPLGFTVHLAEDGQHAVDQAEELRPDAILMDMVLPVKPGIEAVREIRQRPDLKNTVIIAVSASVLDADRATSLMAGCDAFLPKPINPDHLLELLSAHLKLTWRYAAPPVAPELPLIPPPPEELAALSELAQSGRLVEIKDYARRLAQRDAAYQPFVEHLHTLMREVDMERILALVNQFRPKEGQDEPREGEH